MLLVETNLNTEIITLTESSGNGKPLRFRGKFAKLDHKTENGRIYSRKLWENCINSKSVQDRLERRQMLGELKHPDYRDIDIEKSAFVITRLWIQDGYVMGEAEIAPYPALGGILEVFLRLGCQIGISSRGEGSIVERQGDSFVDEKDFDLITFDSTLNPAVTEAIPEVMKEAVQKGLEDLKNKYDEAQKITSKNLELLKENADLTELKRVISITENSIHFDNQTMNTNEKNNFDKGLKFGKIVERYNKQLLKSIQLLKEAEDLKLKLETSNLEVSYLKNLNEKMLTKSETLLESYNNLKDILNQKTGLLEGKSTQQEIFKKDYELLETKYKRSLELLSHLLETVDTYESKVSMSESSLDSLKEELQSLEEREEQVEEENRRLRERTQRDQPKKALLEKAIEDLDSEKESLRRKVKFSESKQKELELKFKEKNQKNIELESQISELTNLLSEAKKTIVKYKRARNSSKPSTLSEDTNSQKSQIRNNVNNLHKEIPSRSSSITNQTKESFRESNEEDDSMYILMNKMMSKQ